MRIEGNATKLNVSSTQAIQSDANVEVNTEKQGNFDVYAGTAPNSLQLMEKKELAPNTLTISEKVIVEAIERANKAVEGINTSFEFRIHEATHEIMVKVLNRDTKEVIREIPPEKVLDMVAKMWELAGIIVDERR